MEFNDRTRRAIAALHGTFGRLEDGAEAATIPIKLRCACGELFDDYLLVGERVTWKGERLLEQGFPLECGNLERHNGRRPTQQERAELGAQGIPVSGDDTQPGIVIDDH